MLRSPSLFVSLQFPFTDLRPFLEEDGHRVSFPSWPLARPDREFVRSTGTVRARWSGGDDEWVGEEVYSTARSALLFENHFGRKAFGPPSSPLRAMCRFRRFFSNGVIARFELGLEFHGRGELIPNLTDDAFFTLLEQILKLEVRVLGEGESRSPTKLGEAGPLLAKHFLRVTTRHADKKQPHSEPWWFSDGLPLLLVEHRPLELLTTPPSAHLATPFGGQDFVLNHVWLRPGKQTLGAWILGSSPTSEKDRMRRLRIHLFRLHAERQGLLETLRQLGAHRLTTNGHEGEGVLWDFLKEASDLLQRKQRYGLDQSELLKVAQGFMDQISPGEKTTMLREIQKLEEHSLQAAPQKGRSVNISGMSANRDTIVTVIENNFFARSQSEATLLALTGDATMKNVSVSGIQSGRDTNIAIADKIVDSMNRIERSDAAPELKEAVRVLVQQVNGLVNDKRLSQDSVKKVEDRLDEFTAEVADVTKREHDRPFYSITAKGLMEAAKAVGEVAAPVIATVTKILNLLAVAV